MAPPAIEGRNLTVGYSDLNAVRGVSFTLAACWHPVAAKTGVAA